MSSSGPTPDFPRLCLNAVEFSAEIRRLADTQLAELAAGSSLMPPEGHGAAALQHALLGLANLFIGNAQRAQRLSDALYQGDRAQAEDFLIEWRKSNREMQLRWDVISGVVRADFQLALPALSPNGEYSGSFGGVSSFATEPTSDLLVAVESLRRLSATGTTGKKALCDESVKHLLASFDQFLSQERAELDKLSASFDQSEGLELLNVYQPMSNFVRAVRATAIEVVLQVAYPESQLLALRSNQDWSQLAANAAEFLAFSSCGEIEEQLLMRLEDAIASTNVSIQCHAAWLCAVLTESSRTGERSVEAIRYRVVLLDMIPWETLEDSSWSQRYFSKFGEPVAYENRLGSSKELSAAGFEFVQKCCEIFDSKRDRVDSDVLAPLLNHASAVLQIVEKAAEGIEHSHQRGEVDRQLIFFHSRLRELGLTVKG